ncbi:hypothetical protein B0H63DRAFT_455499 [Podospora didyma]|uniref:Uncharacterized protein n=1 Tax=Podospora didyma TaxID=330526 RepID=A0AAE0N3G7_9PEZI|nr:hypothetical protein B0H63DRAFT_455499 [Podospora didyma]
MESHYEFSANHCIYQWEPFGILDPLGSGSASETLVRSVPQFFYSPAPVTPSPGVGMMSSIPAAAPQASRLPAPNLFHGPGYLATAPMAASQVHTFYASLDYIAAAPNSAHYAPGAPQPASGPGTSLPMSGSQVHTFQAGPGHPAAAPNSVINSSDHHASGASSPQEVSGPATSSAKRPAEERERLAAAGGNQSYFEAARAKRRRPVKNPPQDPVYCKGCDKQMNGNKACDDCNDYWASCKQMYWENDRCTTSSRSNPTKCKQCQTCRDRHRQARLRKRQMLKSKATQAGSAVMEHTGQSVVSLAAISSRSSSENTSMSRTD